MKIAASIAIWIGWVCDLIIGIRMCINGLVPVQKYVCGFYPMYECREVTVPGTPPILWIFFVVLMLFLFIFTLVVQTKIYSATSKRQLIGYGVTSIILLSILGGVLILCIPERELC